MYQNKPKVYYTHVPSGDIYRIDAEGFTMDTGEKRCILRNLTDGKRWDIAYKDLEEVRLIDGRITNVWERMPLGWYPKKADQPYPGYADDPRQIQEVEYGFNPVLERHHNRSTATDNAYQGRAGFIRR